MKISEMIANLEDFKERYGDLECWYAMDDDGNGYQRVHFDPSFKYVDLDGEMYNDEEDLEFCDLDIEDVTPVCIVN